MNSINHVPVLPLRDMVVYPHGVHPLFVGTESSIRALDAAMADDKQILLVAKRDALTEDVQALTRQVELERSKLEAVNDRVRR